MCPVLKPEKPKHLKKPKNLKFLLKNLAFCSPALKRNHQKTARIEMVYLWHVFKTDTTVVIIIV